MSIYKAIEIAKLIDFSPTILVELALQELVNSAGLNYAVKLKKRVG